MKTGVEIWLFASRALTYNYVKAHEKIVAQSYNRYSYCWNNPLKFVDPSGYANDLSWMDIQMRNYCWGTSYTNTDYGWVNTYWYNDFMDYVNSESDGFSTRNGKSGFWIDDSEWNYQLYKKTATFDQRWDNIAWGNKFSTFDLTSTFVSFEDAISKYTLELEWELIRGFNLDRDYYNYSGPGTMAEADGRGTLYWTGIGLGVAGTYPYLKERSYVKDGMWRSSKNGKWYDIEKRPNGTTGPRSPVSQTENPKYGSENTALGVSKSDGYEINIFPNPTTDEVFVTHSFSFVKVDLFSELGQLLSEVRSSASKVSLDLSSFEPGVYYLRIIHDNGVIKKKIIKL